MKESASDEPPIEPPRPAHGLVLPEHIPCDGCEYDLFGLPLAGFCPECGAGVTASIIAHRRRGRGLAGADAPWLAGLARAVSAMLMGLVAAVVASIVFTGGMRSLGFSTGGWWHLTEWGLTAYAVWRLGVPERGTGAVNIFLRAWPIVAALLPVAAIAVLNLGGDPAVRGTAATVLPWLSVTAAAATVWMFQRLAVHAGRAARYPLAAHCRIAGWGLAIMSLVVSAMLFWKGGAAVGGAELLVLMPTAGLDHAGLAPLLFGEMFRVISLSGPVVWQYYVWVIEPVFVLWALVVLLKLNTTFREAARRARTRDAVDGTTPAA